MQGFDIFAALVDILVVRVGIWVGFAARCLSCLVALHCPAMKVAAAVAAVVVVQEGNIVDVAA